MQIGKPFVGNSRAVERDVPVWQRIDDRSNAHRRLRWEDLCKSSLGRARAMSGGTPYNGFYQ